jgi:hypothetical protein
VAQHRYTLAELEAHGFDVRQLTAQQQDILRSLTSDEFTLLLDIKARLDAAAPEVQAHSEVAGAALF